MDREELTADVTSLGPATRGRLAPTRSVSPTAGAAIAEVVRPMLHFTCDLCGKEMLPGDDRRYVVKMEVYAAHDPAEITEADLDEDHMEEVSQQLAALEDNPAG